MAEQSRATRRGPGPVRRVRIRRRGDRYTIDKHVIVDEMTIPPSQELPQGHGRALSGFWIELVAGDGEVLYRRALHDPGSAEVEVPGAGGRMERATRAGEPDVTFEVLVPDLDAGVELRLFDTGAHISGRSATPAQPRLVPPEPVARFDLRDGSGTDEKGRR